MIMTNDGLFIVESRSDMMEVISVCGYGDVIKLKGTSFEFRPLIALKDYPILTTKGKPFKSGATEASELIKKIKASPQHLWGGR